MRCEFVLLLLLLLLRRRERERKVRRQHGLLRTGVMADRRVLFVCVENACRSLMAEAIFAASAPAGWVAVSAGTRPAAHPNPRTAGFLREVGLALPPHAPRELTAGMMDGADLVVTMGCLDDASCPARLKARPLRDWGLADPAKLDDEGFRAVRDEIARRIAGLIGEIRRPGPSSGSGERPP
jgi:arsenate reductase